MIIGAEIHGLQAAMAELRVQSFLSVVLPKTYSTPPGESSASVANGKKSAPDEIHCREGAYRHGLPLFDGEQRPPYFVR
jgi:hypothetical protein